MSRLGHRLGPLAAPVAGLLDLIHPPTCSLCDELLDDPLACICPACRFGFDELLPPLCERCGLPLAGRTSCAGCARTALPLEQIRSAFAFGGPVQQAVLALKLAGRRELADALADELAAAELPGFDWSGVELLLPVPLHRRRLADRGFNQSVLLARRLAQRLGLRWDPSALVRTRPTPPQAGLADRQKRFANVQQAFAVRRPARIAGLTVCLVDDVVTTGATLAACAGALRAAGARSVRAVSVARTLPQ